MRRLLFVLLLGSALVGLAPTTAAGAATPVDPAVQGTYKFHDDHASIIVGYICPGYTNELGTDPHANFYALVTTHGHDGASVSIMRHSVVKLDESLYSDFGLQLSDTADQVLADDAATIICT